MKRPLYHEFAWAYEAVVAQPAGPTAAAVAAALTARGVGPGASLLDAGCGIGRYAHDAVIERCAETPRGAVAFTSRTTLEPKTHAMRVHERVSVGDGPAAEYDFAMRCWTRAELTAALGEAGFAAVELDAIAAQRADRIVAIAR